jgi:phosphatidate cytidylyltransferase
VWRERQEDWDDTDAILGDLASAGLHVTAYEESSADDPFAYDFLDLDDDASWGAMPERMGSPQAVAAPQASEPTSAADHPVGDAGGQEAGPPLATDLVGPEEVVSARIARRHRRHATQRVRPVRPLLPERATADPTVSDGTAVEQSAVGAARTAQAADTRLAPRAQATSRAPARNPVVATLTGLALAAVLLATFFVGPLAVLVVVTLSVTLAVAELFSSLRVAGYRPATLIALVGAPGMLVAAYFRGPDAVTLGLVAYVVLAMIWYLVGVTRQSPVANLAVSVLGFAWLGVLGAFAGLLLNTRIFPDRHGIAFMLGAIIAAVGYDVGGYAVGSRLGRHKLVPAISPNKTWEGLIGGCVVAVAASAGITSQIHPWKVSTALVLGLIVAVVAPIGDLVESMIKRDLGVKDMGSLLPGHGGMLDRIDALLFVIPATYCFVRLAHIG